MSKDRPWGPRNSPKSVVEFLNNTNNFEVDNYYEDNFNNSCSSRFSKKDKIMILKDGSKLNLKNIETLNALGPYSMAIWKSGDVELGNEESLAGRSQYFLNF